MNFLKPPISKNAYCLTFRSAATWTQHFSQSCRQGKFWCLDYLPCCVSLVYSISDLTKQMAAISSSELYSFLWT